MSYDDDEYIRSLYKDFNLISEQWTYCGTSSVIEDGQVETKRQGKELLISNY